MRQNFKSSLITIILTASEKFWNENIPLKGLNILLSIGWCFQNQENCRIYQPKVGPEINYLARVLTADISWHIEPTSRTAERKIYIKLFSSDNSKIILNVIIWKLLIRKCFIISDFVCWVIMQWQEARRYTVASHQVIGNLTR